MPAKVSATKLLEQQKMQSAIALQKQNQSYQLVESSESEEEEKTSKKSKKSKKRQLRAKKDGSESEE